jgi:hypothetical protein
MKLYGSFACLICIFARFNCFKKLLFDKPNLVTVFCSIYCFSFVCLCISAGCLCITRILCIKNMSFVETIGEYRIRLILSTFTIFVGIIVTSIFVIVEDINSGTPLALLNFHVVPPGELLL